MEQPSLPPVAARQPVDNLPAHSARLWTARRWRYAGMPTGSLAGATRIFQMLDGLLADASLRSLSASRQARKAAHSRLADRLRWETARNGPRRAILHGLCQHGLRLERAISGDSGRFSSDSSEGAGSRGWCGPQPEGRGHGPLTLNRSGQPVRVGAGTKGVARHPCSPSLTAASGPRQGRRRRIGNSRRQVAHPAFEKCE